MMINLNYRNINEIEKILIKETVEEIIGYLADIK